MGSFLAGLRLSLRICCNFRYTRRVELFAVSCDVSCSYIWMSFAVSCGETFRCFFDVCRTIIFICEFDTSLFESFMCCQIAVTTFLCLLATVEVVSFIRAWAQISLS